MQKIACGAPTCYALTAGQLVPPPEEGPGDSQELGEPKQTLN